MLNKSPYVRRPVLTRWLHSAAAGADAEVADAGPCGGGPGPRRAPDWNILKQNLANDAANARLASQASVATSRRC